MVQGSSRGLQVGIGNNVEVLANVSATGTSFTAASKHTQGDTYYAVDGDSTAAYFDQDTTSVGVTLTVETDPLPASTTIDNLAVAANTGPSGSPWAVK